MEVITLFGAFLQSSRPQAGVRAQKLQNRFANIRKTLPRAQRHRGNFFSIDEQRDIFSRMVGARRCGIAAVIGGDHKHIIRPQMRQKTSQPAVKGGNGGGVAGHIVAVAIQHIKINKIDKAEAAKILVFQPPCLRHAIRISFGWDRAGDAAPSKNIADFPHGERSPALLPQQVEHCNARSSREKSCRFAVRVKCGYTPVKGRAITRPTACLPVSTARALRQIS